MKKILYIATAATLALASCSSESDMAEQNPQNENGSVAVEFANPYLGTTRATVIDLDGLKTKGFGVYAYEQGSIAWDTYRSSNVYPNFFYNQQVKVKAGESDWTYLPVKYFSNNIGAKHSFFAYAPYNESNNAIFSMANDAPVIRYSAKDDYDLLWAPAIIDQVKPGVNSKLSFQFQHALSKVSFDVAPFIDNVHDAAHTPLGTVTPNTTITVRSVKFTGKVPSQGLLNLRDGKWTIEATEEGAYEITKPVKFEAGASARQDLISDMMVIPATAVKVKVVYDVTTIDEEHPKNNSTVTNVVESEETFDLEKGTAYTFHLDLGLTSVKFTADVDPWGSEDSKDVDLPNNYTVLTAAANYTYSDYTYVAELTISGSDAYAKYKTQEIANANMVNDIARFLGALYRASRVQEIEYNNVKYHWDTAGTLKGSNWKNNSNQTLVSQLPNGLTAGTTVNLKCDGVEISFRYIIG